MLVREKGTGRWYDEERQYYLLEDGSLEESR